MLAKTLRTAARAQHDVVVRRIGIVLIAYFAVSCPSAVALARENDEAGWRLRVDFVIIDPGSDPVRTEIAGSTVRADFDTGGGIGVRGEYQISRRLGIDFGLLTTSSVSVSAASSGTASVDVGSFSSFIVGVDFHLTPASRVDLYIGPQVALVNYGDVETVAGPGGPRSSVSVGNDLGFGAILGLDVPFGEERHWAFQTSLRFLSTSMESSGADDGFDVDFDPVIFSLGFGYRW